MKVRNTEIKCLPINRSTVLDRLCKRTHHYHGTFAQFLSSTCLDLVGFLLYKSKLAFQHDLCLPIGRISFVEFEDNNSGSSVKIQQQMLGLFPEDSKVDVFIPQYELSSHFFISLFYISKFSVLMETFLYILTQLNIYLDMVDCPLLHLLNILRLFLL